MMLMQQKTQTRGPVTAGSNSLIISNELMQNVTGNFQMSKIEKFWADYSSKY